MRAPRMGMWWRPREGRRVSRMGRMRKRMWRVWRRLSCHWMGGVGWCFIESEEEEEETYVDRWDIFFSRNDDLDG
jgi:hypothetical protein